MIIHAKKWDLAYTACFVAAILSEGDPLHFDFQGGNHSDLELRLQLFELQNIPRSFEGAQVKHKVASRIKKLALKLVGQLNISKNGQAIQSQEAGRLTMLAYPDRVAQLRGKGYRLRSGQGCQLLPDEALKRSDFLAVAHLTSSKSAYQHNSQNSSQSYIRLAAKVSKQEITDVFEDQFIQTSCTQLNDQLNAKNKLIALQQTCLGALLMDEKTKAASAADHQQFLLTQVQQKGLEMLPLKDHHKALLTRLNLAHQTLPKIYPSFADNILIDEIEEWLMPFLATSPIEKVDFNQALLSRLEWQLQSQLKQDFPDSFTLPTGREASIDYSQTPPVVRAKLQECFGLLQSPTVGKEQVTLNLHLLSPAQKPLAMTHDLAFFWKEAYPQVRKENRGRYAKHPWPEDPLTATASHLTKRRLNDSQ